MKKRKIKTLETNTMPTVEYALYHSRKKLMRDMESRNIELIIKDAPAQTFPVKIDGCDMSVVLIDMDVIENDVPLANRLSALAHEAVHVAYNYFEMMGEEEPAEEEMAYAVQFITDGLFGVHLDWLDKRIEKGGR